MLPRVQELGHTNTTTNDVPVTEYVRNNEPRCRFWQDKSNRRNFTHGLNIQRPQRHKVHL